MGTVIALLIVIITSIWVFSDARRLRAGQPGAPSRIPPVGWLILSLLFWIVAFPLYLMKRADLKAVARGEPRPPGSNLKRIARVVVIGWSIFCLSGVIVGLGSIGTQMSDTTDDWAQTGAALGMGCGMAMWIAIWLAIAGPALLVYLLSGRPAPVVVKLDEPARAVLCKECGKYHDGKAQFCPNCGRPVV